MHRLARLFRRRAEACGFICVRKPLHSLSDQGIFDPKQELIRSLRGRLFPSPFRQPADGALIPQRRGQSGRGESIPRSANPLAMPWA